MITSNKLKAICLIWSINFVSCLDWKYQPFPTPTVTTSIVRLDTPEQSYFVLFEPAKTWVSNDGVAWSIHERGRNEQAISSGIGQRAAPLGSIALVFGGKNPEEADGVNGTFFFDRKSGWREDTVGDIDPPHRYYHAMASFGPGPNIGNRVLLYGGLDTGNDIALSDTWMYTIKQGWSKIVPKNFPTGRAFHAMAGIAGAVVLFGGTANHRDDESCESDVWVFSTDLPVPNWKKLELKKGSQSLPMGRCKHTLTALSSSKFLSFGGMHSSNTSNTLILSLSSDGSVLVKDLTSTYQKDNPWRKGAGASFNYGAANRNSPSIFGGAEVIVAGGNQHKDGEDSYPEVGIWSFSEGGGWVSETYVVAPGDLAWHGMADIGNGTIMMFGGMRADDNNNDEDIDSTFLYGVNGLAGWSRFRPRQGTQDSLPAARAFHTMSTISREDGLALLFGGRSRFPEITKGERNRVQCDTWLFRKYAEFEGEWKLLSDCNHRSVLGPTARWDARTASMGDGRRVLLFGGFNEGDGYQGNVYRDSYIFDIGDGDTIPGWGKPLKTESKPAARCAHAMATLDRGQVILFGGWDGRDNNNMFSDTWLFQEIGSGDYTWRIVAETGPNPGGRRGFGMGVLGPNRVIASFGFNYPYYYGDTWMLYATNIPILVTDNMEEGPNRLSTQSTVQYTWNQLQNVSTMQPQARAYHRACSLGSRGTILYGGQLMEINNALPVLRSGGDTWLVKDGCPKGFYEPEAHVTGWNGGCVKCPNGTYKGTYGISRSECVKCPKGLTTAISGATSVSLCTSCVLDINKNHGICAVQEDRSILWRCFPSACGHNCSQVCPGGFSNACHGRGTCTNCSCTCVWWSAGLSDCSFPISGMVIIVCIASMTMLLLRSRKKNRQNKQIVRLQERLLNNQQQNILELNEGWRINEEDLTWISSIARGGFGEVWRGRWTMLRGDEVAIKKFFTNSSLSSGQDESSTDVLDEDPTDEWALLIHNNKNNSDHIEGMSGHQNNRKKKRKKVRETRLEKLQKLREMEQQGGMLVDADGIIFQDKEISLLMRTRHRRVVLFHGAGRLSTGEIFLVSELMRGGDLTNLLTGNLKVPWNHRLVIARDICAGMAFLHGKSLIHRDLKSMNVLLDLNGRAKIADFGLSRFTRVSQQRRRKRTTSGLSMSSQSTNGSVFLNEAQFSGSATRLGNRKMSNEFQIHDMTCHLGSVLWMAPEILRQWSAESMESRTGSNQVTAKYGMSSDVYSFGIVLYEILVRKLPWEKVRAPLLTNLIPIVTSGQRPHISEEAIDKMMFESNENEATLLIDVMRRCWVQNAFERPSFRQILSDLGGPEDESTVFSAGDIDEPKDHENMYISTGSSLARK